VWCGGYTQQGEGQGHSSTRGGYRTGSSGSSWVGCVSCRSGAEEARQEQYEQLLHQCPSAAGAGLRLLEASKHSYSSWHWQAEGCSRCSRNSSFAGAGQQRLPAAAVLNKQQQQEILDDCSHNSSSNESGVLGAALQAARQGLPKSASNSTEQHVPPGVQPVVASAV